MKTIEGISASGGIAFGKAYVYTDDLQKVPRYDIPAAKVESEYQRFSQAVARSVSEIEKIKASALNDLHSDEINVLNTHLLMLSDPDLAQNVRRELGENLQNVEFILSSIMRTMIAKLSENQDPYLRDRTVDFHDVGKRILNQLMNQGRISLSSLEEDVVLVCRDLLPSDAISMDKMKVKGIAMDAGGKTSHTAILARAFEIPAVLGLADASSSVENGDTVIVDGNKGIFILKPDPETLEAYRTMQIAHRKREVQLMRLNELQAETSDGKLINLKANIEIPEEVEAVLSHGADGIGLFRSEFLFLRSNTLPDEEEQFEAYSRVLKAMGDKPVTIRTLDIGGDKMLRNMKQSGMNTSASMGEKNPIVGWRAIRFCLAHEELFKTQLRAIMRASVYGSLRIMLPLISGIQEVHQALTILEEVKTELRKKKQAFRDDVPVGIMIEVPSAAITSDILSRHSAFFSIGTNDLIQYTIAVDRGNEHIAYLYEPLHPGVLRLLKIVIENAHKVGIPVSMCGEMAGDPLYTLVLIGLGLDEFSMSAVGIPEVKRIIRSTSLAQAEEFVGKIMEMSSASEIETFVKSTMEDLFEIAHY